MDDYELAAELLLSHKAEHTRTLLESYKLPKSGNRDELKGRLTEALGDGEISLSELIDYLDSVESYGKQHLYFFVRPENAPSVGSIRRRVVSEGYGELVDATHSLLLPDKLTRARITFTPRSCRMYWVEPRYRDEHLEKKDYTDESTGIEYRAYRTHITRSVNWIEVNETTAQITLSIGQLTQKSNYTDYKDALLKDAKEVLNLSPGRLLNISSGISKLEKDKTIDVRGVDVKTPKGSSVAIRSSDKRRGYQTDPSAQAARKALGKTAAYLGNFYWKFEPDTRVHAKVYKKDQRLGILAGCNEEQAKHVIGHVLQYSK